MAFITTQAPPNRPQALPAAKETEAEALARYESIAKDIAEVVWSEPPLFKGDTGRVKTATLVGSIMAFEGSFRKDVDLGVGKYARGDNGSSWCLMQIRLGTPGAKGKTYQRIHLDDADGTFHYAYDGESGLGGEDLVKDRKNCIRAGLHILRKSMRQCGYLPQAKWLNIYTSGSCSTGSKASERRMGFAFKWYETHSPGFLDADIMLPSKEPKVSAATD